MYITDDLTKARGSLAYQAHVLKVRLHGRRQAARLARDMLQRDLLHGNSVYMVGSCRARLLHIIHVSAVSEVGVMHLHGTRQAAAARQPRRKIET